MSLTLNLTLILTAPGDANLLSAACSLSHSSDSANPFLKALFEWESVQMLLVKFNPLDPEISYLSRNDWINQSPGRFGCSHSFFGKSRSTTLGLSLLPHGQENTSMLFLPLLQTCIPCLFCFITLAILEELHFCWMEVKENRGAKAL